MSIFARTSPAPKPQSRDAALIATAYAGVLVILALTQLFTYENFPAIIDSFGLPGGTGKPYAVAAILVVAEVLALPFLLRMSLSPAFRWFSLGCGVLAPAIWLALNLWAVLTDAAITNIGFLGSVVEIIPGWWAVFVSAALCLMAVWAVWGMWPLRKAKRSTKS